MKNCEPFVPIGPAVSFVPTVKCFQSWRTGTGVGHGEEKRLLMLDLEVFVLELLSINRFTSGTIARCEISSLNHERLDDTMES